MKWKLPVLLLLITVISCSRQSAKHPIDQNAGIIQKDTSMNHSTDNHPLIIDSRMTFEEAIAGTTAPEEIINQLVLIDVEYYSDDNQLHAGQLVVNKSIEQDIREIFELIKEIRFPVHKAVPITVYDWDDERSMAANNTSAFCYRKVAGTNQLSRHAKGKAIDINPFFNPVVWKNEFSNRPNIPEGAVYDKNQTGTFYREHPIVQAFIQRKFTWGYYLKNYYDYHHFHRD